MKRQQGIGVLLFFIAGAVFSAEEGEGRRGRVVAATVYRDRALVTRLVEVDLTRGSNRIEIPGLPGTLDQDSLRASAHSPFRRRSAGA